jgi:ABC-type oligopeptide transport system substrate-binding subunit
MKKLASVMLAVSLCALFITACSKDEKPTPAGGSFSVDGKAYNSNYAYWNKEGLVITNIGVAPDYIENYVRILIDSLNYPTYTFLTRANGAYDAKKNFSSAEIRYNASNVAGEGKDITGVTAGTVTVSKSADIYKINYTITLDGGKVVTGSYNGQVSNKAAGE